MRAYQVATRVFGLDILAADTPGLDDATRLDVAARLRDRAPVEPLDLDATVGRLELLDGDVLHLGLALAGVTADAGIPVDPPPTLVVRGRVVLGDHLARAGERYGLPMRSGSVSVT